MPGLSRPKDGVASARLCPGHPRLSSAVIPGRCEASDYDVQLHIVESRDSGSGAAHHPEMTNHKRKTWMAGTSPAMTEKNNRSARKHFRQHLFQNLPADRLVGR